MGKTNLIGHKFGRLLVVSESESIKRGNQTFAMWLCKCDCGQSKFVRAMSLVSGNTKSCGCLNNEKRIEQGKNNATHSMAYSVEYRTWLNIKSRCYDPNQESYKNYGARGIKVCERWLNSFENFYADMGYKPKGLTIERINNDGDYEPGNCKWATHQEQQNNKRLHKRINISKFI